MDVLVGDPKRWPHPVRLFGAAIAAADRARDDQSPPRRQLVEGAILTAALAGSAFIAGRAVERHARPAAVVLAASSLAWRSLDDAVVKVQHALERDDLLAARTSLREIVGRDVDVLDTAGVATAALETLAESLCDGVVAPLLWLRAGGLGGALAFKAVSTLDSMIGHREPPYTWFGRAAARADDAMNLLPARIAATAIVVSAIALGGGWSAARRAFTTALRDAPRHASPNGGWPEAALAGALGTRLGGDVTYDGVPARRALLGGAFPPPSAADVARGRRIVALAAAIVAGAVIASASPRAGRTNSRADSR
ncbi:MAG: cobalamin biosynthesis protein CobD [Candidatus Eremiobacteraeota bacterium]|nr:cobalamin biosynthesis protein CobD [Candidatus Eremiobacteraeota bacterium]